MNERIRELMIEAGYAAPELAGRAQKLAELIVKECANIVNSLEQYEGQGDCSTAEYIKERFGVEE